jgi:hypothetical protein
MPADPRSRAHPLVGIAAGAALLGALLGAPGARADSILLTWTAPGDDGATGQASTYQMRYSATSVSGPDTASWWSGATPVAGLPAPSPAGTRESFLVTGLTSSTTYYFVIRTADEVPNWSGFSNIAVRQTSSGGGSTLATPQGFSASAETGGVTLVWQPVTTGTAVGYRLSRRTLPDTTRSLVATLPLQTASYADTTAGAGVTYEYLLASYDASGEGTPATATVSVPNGTVATAATPDLHGYPNPAHGHVTIRFDVRAPAGGHVRLAVFDLTGRRICTLYDGTLPSGPQSIPWACRSDRGGAVAPGIYNVILDTPDGRNLSQIALLP